MSRKRSWIPAQNRKPHPEDADENPVRRRIVGAAFSVFMEHGYAETSTLEIATRARVSKRELYALVGNKQEMLVACISERAKRLRMPEDMPPVHDRESSCPRAGEFRGAAPSTK